MKLHIECLQEKIDGMVKEKDNFKAIVSDKENSHRIEIEKFNKIIKTLEEELMIKAEKIKELETHLSGV